ncbi:MAG: hypothetical protein WC446_07860 [Candidatus Paceibacterota bacterium]|jgi:hypothetical protein|nr:hypothetical protein [Erysipelotrichia bacterium]
MEKRKTTTKKTNVKNLKDRDVIVNVTPKVIALSDVIDSFDDLIEGILMADAEGLMYGKKMTRELVRMKRKVETKIR